MLEVGMVIQLVYPISILQVIYYESLLKQQSSWDQSKYCRRFDSISFPLRAFPGPRWPSCVCINVLNARQHVGVQFLAFISKLFQGPRSGSNTILRSLWATFKPIILSCVIITLLGLAATEGLLFLSTPLSRDLRIYV